MDNINVRKNHTGKDLASVYARIGQCILEERRVEALLKTGEAILGNPIILSDLTTRVYAYSSKESFENIDDEILKESTQRGFLPAEFFRKYNYEALLPEISRLRQAKYFKSDMPQKLNRITVNVFVKEQYFGWLVSPEVNRPFTSDDLDIMDCIAQGVSLLLSSHDYGWKPGLQERILEELLQREYASEKEYQERVTELGWNAAAPYRLIGIRQTAAQGEQILAAVQNHLSLAAPEIPATRSGRVLFLLSTGKNEIDPETILPLLAENRLQAACSAAYTDILDTHRMKEQVTELLNAAAGKEDRFFLYEQEELALAAYRVKSDLNYPLDCCRRLQAALDYDAEYRTEYTSAIREWLKWRNLAKTAEKLYIHRNTMVYRFEKFQEISGFDLKEGDDIYKLQLAFLLLENER